MAEKNKKRVGRPPKYTSKEEIQGKIDTYFKDCEGEVLKDKEGNIVFTSRGDIVYTKEPKPPTITGLALALGFATRGDLLRYQGKKEFSDTITRAKSFVEEYTERRLFDRNGVQGAYNDNDGFFSKVGAIGVKIGLEWGGNWTSPVDKPHFQLPYWGSTTTMLKNLYGTPEEFKKTWSDEEMEKVYNWTVEVPDWARPTVQKLLDKGYLKGNDKGELELTYSMLKLLVINDRAGLYD